MSAAWLSEDWVRVTGDALGAHPGLAGSASGLVAVEVTGADAGSYWRRWEGGVPTSGGVGKPDDVADLTLGIVADDAQAFWRGEWSPSVAFMRGQLKAAGDMTLLFALLAASARPEVIAVVRSVGAGVAG